MRPFFLLACFTQKGAVSKKEEVLYADYSSIAESLEHSAILYTNKEHPFRMSKRKQLCAMDELEEEELLAEQDPIQVALDSFFADGLITEVLYRVKRGKEATVYCCRAHPSTGADLLAAKVYRPRNQRSFKNDAIYQEGRVITNGQIRRAVKNKSRFGRQMQFGLWVNHESEVLKTLARGSRRSTSHCPDLARPPHGIFWRPRKSRTLASGQRTLPGTGSRRVRQRAEQC